MVSFVRSISYNNINQSKCKNENKTTLKTNGQLIHKKNEFIQRKVRRLSLSLYASVMISDRKILVFDLILTSGRDF